MRLSAGLVAIFAVAVQGQSIHDLFGTDQFRRAFFEARTGEVTFDPFQEFNWETKARAALPWLNIDRPTPAQIARLSSYESAGPQFRSANFRAPLDPAVRGATYVLLHMSGAVELQPVQLKGSVSLDFNPAMTTVVRKAFSGVIVGKPSRAVASAVFVVAGKGTDVSEVHPGAKFEKRSQTGPAIYDLRDGSRTVSWMASAKDQMDVASALSFRYAGQSWLLVQWKSSYCESEYSLLTVGVDLKPVAGNAYGCE